MKKLLFTFLISYVSLLSAQKLMLTKTGYANEADPTQDYVIIDFPGKSQSELQAAAKSYFTSLHGAQKYAKISEEDDQISVSSKVINLIPVGRIYSNQDYPYTFVFTFRDGKVKMEPIFVYGASPRSKFGLVNGKGTLSNHGIYDGLGNVTNLSAKMEIENFTNVYISNFKEGTEKVLRKDNW